MNRIISTGTAVRQSLRGNGLRARLLRGGIGSLLVKIASTMLGFSVSVLLARGLGISDYGIYSFVLAMILLLVIPTRFGLTSLVLRETARADADANWGLMRGLWLWADRNVALISLGTISLGGIGILIAGDRLHGDMLMTSLWGLALIPALAMINIRGATLTGLRRPIQGQLPEFILRPALLAGGFLSALLIMPETARHPSFAMSAHVMAAICALGLVSWLRRRYRPAGVANKPEPQYRPREWRRDAFPLAFAEGARILHMQVGILLLGFLRPPDEVGQYQVAVQLGLFVSFVLGPIGVVMSPHAAKLHHEGARDTLKRIIRQSAMVSALGALVISVIFLVFGRIVLGVVYGPEYVSAYPVLAIFCVNHLIFSSLGPQGVFLNMLGLERVNLRAAIWGTAVNALLCLLLIPEYGPVGAALGFLCASILVTAYSAWRLNRETGFLGS